MNTTHRSNALSGLESHTLADARFGCIAYSPSNSGAAVLAQGNILYTARMYDMLEVVHLDKYSNQISDDSHVLSTTSFIQE